MTYFSPIQMAGGFVHGSDESSALLTKGREARLADPRETAQPLAAAAMKQDPNDLEAR